MIGRACCVAGSDSGGGAGIQADLKTFAALKVFGCSVITSVTAQNTQGVLAIHDIPAEIVDKQLVAILEDIGTDAIKIGMLSSSATIETVSRRLSPLHIPIVLDPVMVAKGGASLLQESAVGVLKRELIPLATLLTPNIPEAEHLLAVHISSLEDMKSSCRRMIGELGAQAVLLKGGHLEGGDIVVDVLMLKDGGTFEFSSPRVSTKNTHGTGCTLSSAITAYLARGKNLCEAVQYAKQYVTGAIQHNLQIGSGHGPLHHLWEYYSFTERKFSSVLWESIEGLFAKILKLPFIEGLIDGSLPLDTFKRYLIQDKLFLDHFGRALYHVAAKVDAKYIPYIISNSDEVGNENNLQKEYFESWGLSEHQVQETPQSPICLLYTTYLTNITTLNPGHEGLAVVLPCFWIYAEVGKFVLKHTNLQSNPYSKWISAYADPHFNKSAQDMLLVVDQLSQQLDRNQKQEMMKHFKMASNMEYKFWQIDNNNPWE
eukprot:TRINITY_DN16178_c0_g1_i2.p1 TRINITY_DN16178_c0_g1~~TRINITY_DN16178_c0_g1_i2.p1  ORF type:complete len:486 (-),score=124.79 TRINITY_DN16178_c0_g1_i2:40-1497(-)